MSKEPGLFRLFAARIWSCVPVLGLLPVFLPPPAAPASSPIFPGVTWDTASPAEMGLDPDLLREARDYALGAGGAGMIIRGGKLVMSWGDVKKKFDIKSSTKSYGATLLGLALSDGMVALDDPARTHHPDIGIPPDSNATTGWLESITLLHLATQTAGFDKAGGYTKLLFEPGSMWMYSDGGPNWLAECLTLAYGIDMRDLLFERVLEPMGMNAGDLHWRNNAYRDHTMDGIARREFGSGIHTNADALARLGYLYLQRGRWNGELILDEDYIDLLRRPVPRFEDLEVHPKGADLWPGAPNHYGLLWWNNADGALAGVPGDAYWTWGLYNSHVVVIPSMDLVVSRVGPPPGWPDSEHHYEVLAPFLGTIARAVDPATFVAIRMNTNRRNNPGPGHIARCHDPAGRLCRPGNPSSPARSAGRMPRFFILW